MAVKLIPKKKKLNKTRQTLENDVLGILKGMVKQAESGELTGIAVFCTLESGDIATVYGGDVTDNVFKTYGGIHHLARRFYSEAIEEG
jgi:hypothetical protein